VRQIVMKSVALALLFGLVTGQAAQAAYVDPSVGGMLFQVLAAGFAVLSGIILLFSRQIRMTLARLRRSLRREPSQDTQSTGDVQPHLQSAVGQEER
jgi:hypothetical protein